MLSAASFVDCPQHDGSHKFSHFDLCSRPSRFPKGPETGSAAARKARRPLTEVKVAVELIRICQPNPELMVLPPNQDKEPLSNDGLDCRLSGPDKGLEDWVDQASDRPPLPRRSYRNQWTLDPPRLDAYKRATGHQVLPRPLEGMDHALDCDSSKRPAEERDVKRAAARR